VGESGGVYGGDVVGEGGGERGGCGYVMNAIEKTRMSIYAAWDIVEELL
jgi:hypothetical protein